MMLTTPDFIEITSTAEIRTDRHGNRAKCLQRLIRLDLPVPMTVALSFDTVRAIAQDQLPDMASLSVCSGTARSCRSVPPARRRIGAGRGRS
jgi:pyruvate,orthophosphate dikinase